MTPTPGTRALPTSSRAPDRSVVFCCVAASPSCSSMRPVLSRRWWGDSSNGTRASTAAPCGRRCDIAYTERVFEVW